MYVCMYMYMNMCIYILYIYIYYIYIYVCIYIKTMYPPCYHHNSFVATRALGHMMHGYTFLVSMNQRLLNKQSKEHNISDNINKRTI